MKMRKNILFAGLLTIIVSAGLSGCSTNGGTYGNGYNNYQTSSYQEANVYTGTVVDINEIVQPHQNSGGGIVLGAIAGGLLGHTVGGGSGRTLATVAGAVGGGFAGNAIENRSRPNIHEMITIRARDGSITQIEQPSTSLRIGDRVQVTQSGSNIQVLRIR